MTQCSHGRLESSYVISWRTIDVPKALMISRATPILTSSIVVASGG